MVNSALLSSQSRKDTKNRIHGKQVREISIHHTVIPIKLNPHGLIRGLIRSDWCQYTCNQLDSQGGIKVRVTRSEQPTIIISIPSAYY